MAGGHAWQGGHVWQGGMHDGGHAWQILRDTVNERAVRILLECILVVIVNGYLQECLETRSSSIRFLTRKRIKIIETGRLLSVVTSSMFFFVTKTTDCFRKTVL